MSARHGSASRSKNRLDRVAVSAMERCAGLIMTASQLRDSLVSADIAEDGTAHAEIACRARLAGIIDRPCLRAGRPAQRMPGDGQCSAARRPGAVSYTHLTLPTSDLV